MHIGVDANDDHVRENVPRSHDVHDIGVLERDLLGDLHHHKDDDQIGDLRAMRRFVSVSMRNYGQWAFRNPYLRPAIVN